VRDDLPVPKEQEINFFGGYHPRISLRKIYSAKRISFGSLILLSKELFRTPRTRRMLKVIRPEAGEDLRSSNASVFIELEGTLKTKSRTGQKDENGEPAGGTFLFLQKMLASSPDSDWAFPMRSVFRKDRAIIKAL
jgi:hypothetical protein